MKKRLSVFILCVFIAFSLFPLGVSADMGPKASVSISFQNMGNEKCYATLLSEEEYFGPYSVWDGNEDHIYNHDLDMDIWRKFVEYEDPDGFVFLQTGWDMTEEKTIRWGYFPPHVFKILLYFPDTDTFISSEICEEYAFDTYYTVDMSDIDISSSSELLKPYRSYDYTLEIISLLSRIILTILVEIGIGLLFGIKRKKELLMLAGVNTATQIILNVLLNIVNYRSGQLAFTLIYIPLEIGVFVIESIVFCIFMNMLSDQKRKKRIYVLYALVSNLVSFLLGMFLAEMIPGIF